MMQPSLVTVLSHELFPLLQLGSLRAISGSCTLLRAAVTATKAAVWLRVARCYFKRPLCSVPRDSRCSKPSAAETLCQRAILCVQLLLLDLFQSMQIRLPCSTPAYEPAR